MPITRMFQRRGTAAEWSSANPVLGSGEIGFEVDTNRFKIGNGSAPWGSLPYKGETGANIFVREVNGTYAVRPSTADVPNAIWIGTSDATQHAAFVEWESATGIGDTWQQVPA